MPFRLALGASSEYVLGQIAEVLGIAPPPGPGAFFAFSRIAHGDQSRADGLAIVRLELLGQLLA